MKIEGVIFDLDGTLIDTIEDIAGAANTMFRGHGLPEYEPSHYLKWVGSGAVRLIEQAHGAPVSQEQLMTYVAEFKEIYASRLHDRSHVYTGIPEILDALTGTGIRISILSNKPHHLTRKVAEFYLSRWPFEPVLGQRDGVPRKPDPAAAFEIAGILNILPERILFVGDSQNDMLTARAAGMVPLAVSWGYGSPDIEAGNAAYRMIDQPGELLDLI
jgi:phosphoglycolate phosphatase